MLYNKGGIIVKNKINSISGWSIIGLIIGLLIVVLLITIVEQSLFMKNTTLLKIIEKAYTEGYGIMYAYYSMYVLFRVILLIVPTVGAALLIRELNEKNEINDLRSKKVKTVQIYSGLLLWCIVIVYCFAYKISFEDVFLNQPTYPNWVALCQLYEVVVPALALTFVDNSYLDIRNAKKIRQYKKLPKVVEKKTIEVFSEGDLTEREQLHLLKNLEKQKAKILRNRH